MFDKLKQSWSARGKPTGHPNAATTLSLATRLQQYAPYNAPHAGWGKQLSVEQAEENLAYFQAALAQRLSHIGILLKADAGLDIAPALQAPGTAGLELTDALNLWASQRWPALHSTGMAAPAAWLSSRRGGPDIIWSMVLDVGILLGELIRRANPDWRWAVDLNPRNLKDEMPSARRVVLMADAVGAAPQPFVEDVEDVVATRLQQIDRDDARCLAMNPWRRMVDEDQRGVPMTFYRG